MMGVIILKSDNLKTIVNSAKKVLVFFGSVYCNTCKNMMKRDLLGELAKRYPDILFVYVDSENFEGEWNFEESMELLKKEPTHWTWFVKFEDGKYIDYRTTSILDEIKQLL